MRRFALLAVLALAACSSDQQAEYRYAGPQAPPSIAGQSPAPAAAVEKLVTGNTLVGVTREGWRWARHMRAGGYFTAYTFPNPAPGKGQQWTFTRGVWRAADGRLCFRPEEARQENCLKIVTEGGVLHAYTEKEGAWRFSAEVRPGNPFEM